MPGVYREKECPTCGTKHRKKGQYCSKTCSNKGRDDVYKEKMRDKKVK
jgi:predicted nucleic acid-binding Zn ribbon protein